MLVLLNLCCAMMGDKMRWKRVREGKRGRDQTDVNEEEKEEEEEQSSSCHTGRRRAVEKERWW